MPGDTPMLKPSPALHAVWMLLRLFKYSLIALVIVVPINMFVAAPFIVAGPSMIPQFNAGDYVVIDRLAYRDSAPQRGDVIVFRYPLDQSVYFIKRIIAMPGETVTFNGNDITVATGTSATSYASVTDNGTTTITLASDEYFVVGDNVASSTDSRQWGPLQKKFIIGRVDVRLWPNIESRFPRPPLSQMNIRMK